MADISASQVKELRERTGAGMMECKRALAENGGDIEAAADWLRKQGLAKADKKAGRVAAEGRVAMAQRPGRAVLVEINSETDFVAKDAGFVAFVDAVAQAALDSADVEALKSAKLGAETVEASRSALIAKVGENVQVRRIARVDSANTIGGYVHGGRIGVLVEVKGGDADLARGLAMHIAAMNPPHISAKHVPAEFVAREREIALGQMTDKDRAKPADIQDKMVAGKVAKTVNEMCLTGQAYVLDTNQNVEAVLKSAGAEVVNFVRLAVGEGIEKVKEDYAAEVMKQAGLA